MTTLAFISLSAPVMLGGLALLSLPVAAHLLNRRAKRRVVFPSIVLIEQTKASQSRLFKLRRLLLLLLRCALVALVVLAFAQPLWLDTELIAAPENEEGATVVVLDASASTGQRAGGVLAIELLRAAASRALDDASGRGDAMNVVVAGGRTSALFPRMSHHRDGLRSALASVEPRAERADLYGAFAEAGRLLGAHAGERRLVVLSDLQASNWVEVQPRMASASPLPERTRVTVIPLVNAVEGNCSVSDLRTSPARPMAGRPARAIATIANLGERSRVVRAELYVDDVAVGEVEALIDPWQQQEVALPFAIDKPGDARLRVRLPDDALSIDNERHHVVRAVERRTIVVIADDDADDSGTGAYFLSRAVAPHRAERARAELRLVRSFEVDEAALRDAASVFVGYVGELQAPALRALHQYVDGGGGLVIFCGSGPTDRNLAALDAQDPRGLLPWRTAGLRDLAADNDALSITHGDWRSPLLRAFDTRSQEAFTHARFRRVWAVQEPHPEAAVLLRFNDGGPAMAERPIGRGRVVVANFSPEPAAGDLPKHGSFVALVQSLIEELEPRDARDSGSLVGQPIRLTASKSLIGGTGLHVVGPGRQPIGTFDVSASETDVAVVLPRGERPGFYELKLRDETLATEAAHLDSRESDLRRIELPFVEAMLASEGGSVAVGAATGAEGESPERGRPLWGWALLAAMGIVAVELGLLGYWRR